MSKESRLSSNDANVILDRIFDQAWRDVDRSMRENERDPRYHGLNSELILMMPHSGMPEPEPNKPQKRVSRNLKKPRKLA